VLEEVLDEEAGGGGERLVAAGDEVPGAAQRHPRRLHLDERPAAELIGDGVEREQGDAEADGERLADGAVGPQGEDRRMQAGRGEVLVGGGAGARPGLAEQPGLAGELLGSRRAGEEPRWRDQDQHVGPLGEAAQRRRVGRTAADHQVDLVVLEQGEDPRPVGHLEADLRRRVALAEPGDQAGEELLAGGGDRRQPYPPPLGGGGGAGGDGGLLEEAEQPAGVSGEHLARRGEPKPAAVTGHQPHPELLLERGDLRRHGGLGDEEALGGGAHRAGRRDLQEGAELAECHKGKIMVGYEKNN
jgi:hypothetical protein